MDTQFVAPLLARSPVAVENGSFFFDPPTEASDDWQRQQQESIDRYQDDSYEADGTIGELFGGFIATTLDRSGPVLDIGCGLHPLLPHYVKNLSLPQFLGIEPLLVRVDRGYACLAGITAEDIPLSDSTANAAIFATSLDHIEDAPGAIKEVLRVLKPGAPLYFWLGVHDPFILAEQKTFGNIHNHAKGWRKAARIVGGALEHFYLMRQMSRRRSDLAKGVPLDHAHVRYHTVAGIDEEFASYGLRIVRRVLVPGSAFMFAEAKAI